MLNTHVLNTEGEAYGLPEKLHFLTSANVPLSIFKLKIAEMIFIFVLFVLLL